MVNSELVKQPIFEVSYLQHLHAAKMQGHAQYLGAAHGRAPY